MLGLYLHIPFCAAICNYCNFNRGLFDAALKARYVEALVTEIERAGQAEGAGARADATFLPADTIFFGGGTPSLLSTDDVERLIDACARSFSLAPDAEITLEANPETVTLESLRDYRRAGVNRLSFGVQSFRDEELVRLSRLHGADRARDAYREARAAGFDNISLDLMMWLPGQRVAQWLESLDEAVRLAPDHLSLYMLEVYPNAPLKDAMARAAWSQAPDDDVAEMYGQAMDRLGSAGYGQYEISNVSRPGRASRHNLKYWSDGNWHGFGCGAHSTIDGVRTKNVSGTGDYIRAVLTGAPTASEQRRLTEDERVGDALFTGLRLTAGLDVGAVNRRYGVDVWQRYGARLQPFMEANLLVVDGNVWKLTRPGTLLAHEVMSVFV
jgi:oxygen-independent coproporphyrinogen III oxidase